MIIYKNHVSSEVALSINKTSSLDKKKALLMIDCVVSVHWLNLAV